MITEVFMKYVLTFIVSILFSSMIGAVEFSGPYVIYSPEHSEILKCEYIVEDVDYDGDDDIIPRYDHTDVVYWVENLHSMNIPLIQIENIHYVDYYFVAGFEFIDMNNDGYKDFVAPQSHCDSLNIYINDGSGNFIKEQYYSGIIDWNEFCIYDFNQDSIMDIYIADQLSSRYLTRVTVNDTFQVDTLGINILFDNRIDNETLSYVKDFNNDGYMDILGLNYSDFQLGFYEFDPMANTFSNWNSIVGSNWGYSYVASDVNTDGTPDIIQYYATSQTLRVVESNNANGYTVNAPFADSVSNVMQIKLADFNNDNAEDIAVYFSSNGEKKIAVYLNQNSNFILSSEIAFDNKRFYVYDADQDGQVDIIGDLGVDYIVYYNENGSFSPSDSKLYPVGYVNSFCIENVGGSDKCIVEGLGYVVEGEVVSGQILMNDKPVRDIHNFNDFAYADIDENGELDYLFVEDFTIDNLDKDFIKVYINGAQTQTIDISFLAGSIIDAKFNDVDNDGDYDITYYSVEDSVGSMKVLENTNNQFNSVPMIIHSSLVDNHHFADVNGDMLCDLLFTYDNDEMNIVMNQGAMTFADSIYQFGRYIREFTYEDIDGDGIKDIVKLDSNGNSRLGLYKGAADGSFSAEPYWFDSDCQFRDVDFVDFDNNGFIDLMFTKRYTYVGQSRDLKLEYIENFFNLYYVNWTTLICEVYSTPNQYIFDNCDVNNDDLQDILVIRNQTGEIKVFLNNTVVNGTTSDVNNVLVTKLYPNNPNPFNPETNINYSLAKGGDVELNVYNLKGQRVRNLIKDNVEAGDHSIIWDGKNDKGADVSSGVYFYQLKTSKFTESRKMLLLK